MVRLVLYCPGDAPGSPAYLKEDEARKLLEQNADYCEVMERATGKKYQLPHINGGCPVCCRVFGGFQTPGQQAARK